MRPVAESKKILSENISGSGVEAIDLSDAAGRILAIDAVSLCNVPSFDNSAMDGFGLRYDANCFSYRIKDTIAAGSQKSVSVQQGEAVRIFTGAPLPEGVDTIVQQEIAEVVDGAVHLSNNIVKRGMNIRRTGAQNLKGETIVKAGTLLTPGTIALLASAGIQNLSVYKAPSVAIITTGNEVQEPGTILEPFRIYNSNSAALTAYLNYLRIKKINSFHCNDSRSLLQEQVRECLKNSDILILTGGISVGEYDFVKECLISENVKQLIYKVKQKPGKPFFAGRKNDKWIFALPGNPAAVLTCFNQYVKPCIKSMMGFPEAWNDFTATPLTNGYIKKAGLTHFVKARKNSGTVTILAGQDSFNLAPFNETNCFVELPEDQEIFSPGTMVNVYDW